MFFQIFISHNVWVKLSNLWCSDYLKVHLRVKKLNLEYLGQSIQEWTKENLWKTAFKNLQFSNFKAFKFLKGCLQQIFYLVHSWILCPISSCFPRLNSPPSSYHHLHSLPGRGKLLTPPQAVFLQKSVLLSELVCLKGLRLSAIYINLLP